MNRRLMLLVTAVAILSCAAAAVAQQQPPPPGAQAQAPGRAVISQPALPPSPEILPDNRVVFRLTAPDATEVMLNGDWPDGMRQAMTKDDQGVWSITVGPLKPELWGYTFSVNGVRLLDPRNPNTKRDGVRYDNILLIPGPESALYEVKDVPHGTVSMVWYESPTLKLTRRMYVYTPPDYATSTARYPVFYLLHGGGGDEDAWFTLGRTAQIMDNLIAQGKAKPMIVVMTNGNANQKMAFGSGPIPGQPLPPMRMPAGRGAAPGAPGAPPGAAPPAAPPPAAPPAGGAPPAPAQAATAGRGQAPPGPGPFPESLVKDVIPFVEKHYRAIPNRDSRAIAGLSMGGGHTLAATNYFPGTFSYIGVWSAGTRQTDDTIVNQLRAVNKTGVKVYYVGCGVEDPLAYTSSKNLVELLKKVDIKYTFRESPGGHTWFNWRIYLSEFAPMLFQPAAAKTTL